MDRPLHPVTKMKTKLFSLFILVFLFSDALAQKKWINWDTFQIDLKIELYSKKLLAESISSYDDYLNRVVKNPVNQQQKKLQNLRVLLDHYNWILEDTIKYIEPTTSMDWKSEWPMKESLPKEFGDGKVNIDDVIKTKLITFRKSNRQFSQLELTMIFLTNHETTAQESLQNDLYTRLKKTNEQQLKWWTELEKRIIDLDSNFRKANLAVLERHDYERKNSHNKELNRLRIQILLAANDARY